MQTLPRMQERPAVAVRLLMTLTFVTGLVDAVGYLALDRVFVGNMTGNIVILGMAVAGGDDLPVLGPVIALVTFTVGAYGAGLALRHRRRVWSGAVTTLLTIGAAVLLALGAAFAVTGGDGTPALVLVASSATAAVMGIQAAVARSLAVADLTTVVVTSTLTSLASESLVDDGVRGLWGRRCAAIGVLFLGALVGALLLRLGTAAPLVLAAALTLGVVLAGHRILHTAPDPSQETPR